MGTFLRRCYYFIWAYFCIIAIHREIRRGGFAAARARFLESGKKNAKTTALSNRLLDDLDWALAEASKWQLKRSDCLHRALACYYFLDKLGAGPAFIIGARARPFASHAWVEVGNHRSIGYSLTPGDIPLYKELMRISESKEPLVSHYLPV